MRTPAKRKLAIGTRPSRAPTNATSVPPTSRIASSARKSGVCPAPSRIAASSGNSLAGLGVGVRSQQRHPTALVHGTEHEDLGAHRADLARREVDDAHD